MSPRRGPHPEDEADFGAIAAPRLRAAVHEVGWLLDRRYPSRATGTLVGDHHQLTARQRRAVMRCACGAEAAARRRARQIGPTDPRGEELFVDGFNVLLTVEVALAGGLLLLGQDGCLRDMASLNGRFVGAAETAPALDHIGAHLEALRFERVTWLFDAPVPHSGRLAAQVEAHAAPRGWPWTARTVPNPDPLLKACGGAVASADGAILERASWLNLAFELIEARIPEARILDLAGFAEDPTSPSRPRPV